MNTSLTVWKELLEISKELQNLKPWENICSSNLICLELQPNDLIYCSIMGKLGDCIGIAVYEGESGYEDLCSIANEYPSFEVKRYVAKEQTCYTWYLGKKAEVPKDQIEIMKELKEVFKKDWPYFIHYEAKYAPNTLNLDEAKRMVEIFRILLDILKAYKEKKISVNFDMNEMIYVHKNDNNWLYEAKEAPAILDKFLPIELNDASIYEDLNRQKRTSSSLYLDLVYLDTVMDDDKSDKLQFVLLFIVADEESQCILNSKVISSSVDEIQEILSFMISYIFEYGIPKKIYVRNPRIFSTTCEICEKCNIKMDGGNFGIIDEIKEQMSKMMNKKSPFS